MKKLALTIGLLFLFLGIFAKSYSPNDSLFTNGLHFYKSGHNNSWAQNGDKLYVFLDNECAVGEYNKTTKALIRKIPLNIPLFKIKNKKSAGGMVFNSKNGFIVVFDLRGNGHGSVWNKNANGIDLNALLVAQEYDKNFKPTKKAINLMASPFQKSLKQIYATRLVFNKDKSKFAVFQSEGLEHHSNFVLCHKTLPAYITVFDNSLNKLAEKNVADALSNKKKKGGTKIKVGDKIHIRDIAFVGDEISTILSYSPYRSKSQTEIADLITLNLKDKSFKTTQIQLSDKKLKERVNYTKFLPGTNDKIIVFLHDFKAKFKYGINGTIRLYQINANGLKKLSEWNLPKNYLKQPESNALCLEDYMGKSNVHLYKNKLGETFVVATRDYVYCSCDSKARKKWQHLFVAKIDIKNKIKVKFYPIGRQKDYRSPFFVYHRMEDGKLKVFTRFSEGYYKKGTKALNPKVKEKNIPGVLEIDSKLKASFTEIK